MAYKYKEYKYGELRELRMRAFLSEHKAAEICGVTLRTWRTWEKTDRPPRAVMLLFNLLRGELSIFGWRGWHFDPNGLLYSPALKDGFSQADINRIWWDRFEIYDLKRERRIAQRKIEPKPIAKTRLCFFSLQLTLTLTWRCFTRDG